MQTEITKFKVSIDLIKKGIAQGEKLFPNEWQGELCEIVMIPEIYKAIQKLNSRFSMERVTTKYGEGYILKGWNSVREDYYSTNPSTVANGLRREYYGIMDIEFLRMVAYGHEYAKTQLKYFEAVA